MKRLLTLIICLGMLASAVPAQAATTEQDVAVQYLAQEGIYQGDQNGNLNLDKGLTRAELAAILTRLDFMDSPGDWGQWGAARFSDPATRTNLFTDTPEWALPYIEYCYQRGLMKGVADILFDPQGKVNPRMACTVMLRYCGVAETDWEYTTSVAKAQELGIAPGDGMDGSTLLRGTMAVIIYRGILYELEHTPTPEPTEPTTPPPTPADPEPQEPETNMTMDEMKAEIIRLTNEERVKAGVPALEVLPELMDCAQAKAQDFLDNHYYSHTSPVYGEAADMIRSYVPQAKSASENIGTWTKTVQDAFNVWLNSPEHYANMISPKYTHIGIGIIQDNSGWYCWVQHFVAL